MDQRSEAILAKQPPPNKRFTITAQLLADKTLSSTAKLVMMALLDHRNKKTGRCFPKRETLAREIGLSLPSITRALAELRDANLIKAKQLRNSNFYEFQADQIDHPEISTGSSNSQSLPDQFDQPAPPVSLYEPIEVKPEEAAALSEVQDARAAAAGNSKKKEKQKPPASATDAGTFQVVREWLYALAPLVHLPPPDDDLVRAVIAAARGAPAKDITAALVALYKGGHLRNMRSWGFIPLKISDCARRATA